MNRKQIESSIKAFNKAASKVKLRKEKGKWVYYDVEQGKKSGGSYIPENSVTEPAPAPCSNPWLKYLKTKRQCDKYKNMSYKQAVQEIAKEYKKN